MLICYFITSVLMISDGTVANPLTSLQNIQLQRSWGDSLSLSARTSGGSIVAYKLDPIDTNLTVDEILLRCEESAFDPVFHP